MGKTERGQRDVSLSGWRGLKRMKRYPSYLANPSPVPNHRKPSLSCRILETTETGAALKEGRICSNRINLCAEENKKAGAQKNKKNTEIFFIMNQVLCVIRMQSFFYEQFGYVMIIYRLSQKKQT